MQEKGKLTHDYDLYEVAVEILSYLLSSRKVEMSAPWRTQIIQI